jgi:hypothetical protein
MNSVSPAKIHDHPAGQNPQQISAQLKTTAFGNEGYGLQLVHKSTHYGWALQVAAKLT